MRRTREIVRLFLASPVDVAEERLVVERVVAEINRSTAPYLGVLLELVRWEDVVPGTGRPQQVVLDQVDIEDCDIFVGVLWNRFGTPTGRADSGTEEEFHVAYRAWQRSGRPRIMLYLCQRPSTLRTQEETEQKARVLRFRESISSLGIVREFATTDEFESALRQDLTRHLFTVRGAAAGRSLSAISEEPGTHLPLTHLLSIPERAPAGSARTPLPGMVKVPAGEFLCGRTKSKVVIDHNYLIDLALVTIRDFVAFVDETGYMLGRMDAGISALVAIWRADAKSRPDHPVTRVSWHDAAAYAAWQGKRLPTAMEWEKAARGTDGRLFPWGDGFDPLRCNSAESGINGTTSVLRYGAGASPYGCLDMAGNVFEWTCDWAERSQLLRHPYSETVNRGGSFNRPREHLLCWYAESDPPDLRMADVGFRCVISLEQTKHRVPELA